MPTAACKPTCTKLGGVTRAHIFLDGRTQQRQLYKRKDIVLALQLQFSVNGDALDPVEVFKYLGHMLSQYGNDAQVVCLSPSGEGLKGISLHQKGADE